MAAYLTGKKLGTQQWYEKRNRPLTGCTVLHTAESVMDTVGPDTGAEAVAEFIRGRTTAGSYHDLVDSDSWIPLVDYKHGAFHDGTGSNNWALSISFACATTDWRAMSPEKRRGFLRQGARAFANQQAYRRAVGAPLTELRLITKAQSDRGESGFTYHGLRDPGRRSDPGVAAPNLFPIDEFLVECLAAMGGAPTEEDPDMSALYETRGSDGRNLFDSVIQTRLELRDRAADAVEDRLFNVRVQGRNLFDWIVQGQLDAATRDAREAARDAALLEVVKAKGAPDPQVVAAAVKDATERALADADFPTAEQIATATLAAQERAELDRLRARVAELEQATAAKPAA